MADIFDMADTWNDAGTTFTAIKMDVTNTASAAASKLLDLRIGGVSQFSIGKSGDITGPPNATLFIKGGPSDARTISLQTSGGVGIGSTDVLLFRDGANILAQRNGANPQAFSIYNTYTDASNYERGGLKWSGGRLLLFAEKAGTGALRDIDIDANSFSVKISATARWYFYNNGHFGPAGDATHDIGTSSLRVRNVFQGGGYHEMAEMTAPAAPSANGVRIYAEDTGAGKTRLMAIFATGAAQQIAIEP